MAVRFALIQVLESAEQALEDLVDELVLPGYGPDNPDIRDRAHQLRRDIQEWRRELKSEPA